MSITAGARATATGAEHNTLLERTVRAGFLGYGLVHLLFAWLAAQIAFGRPAQPGDQTGALNELAAKPLGKVLVVLVGIGLVAMALWQLLEACVGHRAERGKRRVAERVLSFARAVVYGYLAFTAFKVATSAAASGANRQQSTSSHLMTSGGGRFLVGLVGVVLAGVGVGLFWYGAKKKFRRRLMTERMSATTRRVSERLGLVGYASKGIAYAIAGVLFVVAAVKYEPQKARGLDAALRTLAAQPYGTVLLILIALGVACFGLFCYVQARYRKV